VAKCRAAVPEQVKLHIAPARDELFFALIFRPRLSHAATDNRGIGFEEMPSDILCKGKICIPVTTIMAVIENPANAARLIAMFQMKIFVAPVFISVVIRHIMCVAGRFHTCVKSNSIRAVLGAVYGLGWGQIPAAAKPILGRHDIARVHMDRRDARIYKMGD